MFNRYSKSPTYKPSSCELSKVRTCVPSTSGMSEITARPPIADNPSAVPSPISFLLLKSITLLAYSFDARSVCQLLSCTTILVKELCSKIKLILFFAFVYYLCEKYYKLITV